MHLKRETGNKALWLGVTFILLLSFSTYSQKAGVIKANLKQKIQTLDLGYSSSPAVMQILSDLPSIINGKIFGFRGRPAIERIDIDIPLLEYKKILNNRENALSISTLSNPTDVKAKIRHQGKNIKAKLRLKGDLPDHWTSQHRMSFRISLKGNNSVLGLKKFSLHKPDSRQHPFDQTFSAFVHDTGNLSSNHNYIHVYVNGTDWGVMNIEEHMSKEFLEKQGRKDSLIVRFGSEEKSVFSRSHAEGGKYSMYRLSDPRLSLKVYGSDKYYSDRLQRKRVTYIMQQRLKNRHGHLYDVYSYGRAIAINIMWNDSHPLYYSNSKHYFNPYTLRLEPIIADAIHPQPIANVGYLPRRQMDPFLNSELYKELLRNPEYQRTVPSILPKVIRSAQNAQGYLEHYHSYFPLDKKINIEPTLRSNAVIMLRNSNEYMLPSNVRVPSEVANNKDVRQQKTEQHIQAFHRDNGNIEIFNHIADEIIAKNILVDGVSIEEMNVTIPRFVPNLHQPYTIKTPLINDMSGRLSIVTSYNGTTITTPVDPTFSIYSYKLPTYPNNTTLHDKPTKEQAQQFPSHLHVRHFIDGRFEIYNLIDDNVILKEIAIDGITVFSNNTEIPSYVFGDYVPTTITTELKGILDGRLTITSSYQGFTRHSNVSASLDDSDNYNPLLKVASTKLPEFIKQSSLSNWDINPGIWNITSPIVVHGNLLIHPDTTLRFTNNSYLIIKGRLLAEATKEKPIIFEPSKQTWKGIYIYEADSKSSLKHVIIRDTSSLSDGLLSLSGGVTFYKSDVKMEDLLFDQSSAEDALNIVESSFDIKDITITGTRSDGIDTDFSQGTISLSTFSSVGGDALDFSGSEITVNDVNITQVKDKAISAGEATTIDLNNITIKNVGVGIASKDGSQVKGNNIKISNFALRGVMSYMKKSFYAQPSVILDGVTVKTSANPTFTRQKNSLMIINGDAITPEKINVNQLYQSEAMAK